MLTTRHENFFARPDWHTATLVNAGIELAKKRGRKRAAEFMADVGVPVDVAARVLTQPDRWRRPA
jgi:hypothetical protein